MTAAAPIKQCVVEGTKPGPHLLITGGVHGDEFEPMVAIRRLMNLLQADRLQGRVTLVPVVNEPAFLLGSRTGPDGLDLARTCPGRADGTSTEQIAYALSELICKADYYIDLHTGGTAYSVMPLTGYMLHADCEVLEIQRRMARAFNLPIVWGTSPELEGRSLSVARNVSVPAIYAEYLGGGRCSILGIEAYVGGCLNVMRELGMTEHPEPISKVVHIVEDRRPNSGHLQINHPAPMGGCFEPVVELGQQVQQGEVIGRIVADPLGEQACEIRADHGGIVLMLATYSRVLPGSSVGVVLDPGEVVKATEK